VLITVHFEAAFQAVLTLTTTIIIFSDPSYI